MSVCRFGDQAKDAELLVLRHENAVLRRLAGRERYEPADRAGFAALARFIRESAAAHGGTAAKWPGGRPPGRARLRCLLLRLPGHWLPACAQVGNDMAGGDVVADGDPDGGDGSGHGRRDVQRGLVRL